MNKKKEYLEMVAEDAVGKYGLQHADGTPCDAKTPEACPHNKTAQRADEDITGNEHASKKANTVEIPGAEPLDVSELLEKMRKYGKFTAADIASLVKSEVEKYGQRYGQSKGQEYGNYLRERLVGVCRGDYKSVNEFRCMQNKYMYADPLLRDLSYALFETSQNESAKAYAAKKRKERGSQAWSASYEDEVNNPDNPKYNPFYGM